MIRWIAKQAEAWARRRFDNKLELLQALSGIAAIYGSLDLYGIWFAGRLFFNTTPKLLRAAYFRRRKRDG